MAPSKRSAAVPRRTEPSRTRERRIIIVPHQSGHCGVLFLANKSFLKCYVDVHAAFFANCANSGVVKDTPFPADGGGRGPGAEDLHLRAAGASFGGAASDLQVLGEREDDPAAAARRPRRSRRSCPRARRASSACTSPGSPRARPSDRGTRSAARTVDVLHVVVVGVGGRGQLDGVQSAISRTLTFLWNCTLTRWGCAPSLCQYTCPVAVAR